MKDEKKKNDFKLVLPADFYYDDDYVPFTLPVVFSNGTYLLITY